MLSSIRAKCQPDFRGITMTFRVCTGTITGQAAIKDVGLLASVVEHKKIFCREASAYDLARPGSLPVCPPDSHVAQILSDYRDMREMFFGETPPFHQVIADLIEVEDRVNA